MAKVIWQQDFEKMLAEHFRISDPVFSLVHHSSSVRRFAVDTGGESLHGAAILLDHKQEYVEVPLQELVISGFKTRVAVFMDQYVAYEKPEIE